VRYPGPDGVDRPAPETFVTKTEADRWLSLVEAELAKRTWVDPKRGDIQLSRYAEDWVRSGRV
jgi:hypothetical protein